VYAGKTKTLLPELVEIIKDELNVKAFEFVAQVEQLVTVQILPDNKLLGPKYGALFPKIRAALAKMEPAKVAALVQAGLNVPLQVDDQTLELEPAEILVQTKAAEGLAVAYDKLATVAIDTRITPELRAEGLARELVRRIQAMRKEAGFNIEDRINTYYQADAALADIFQSWGDYIKAETLTVNLLAETPPPDSFQEKHQIDGHQVLIGVKR
jgi:isoleucyl-tRNA synthetase